MASIFSKIIAGQLPGRFVWSDDRCVAFLTINPLTTGHTLVGPREEIEHWIDLPADLWAHLAMVSQTIGTALQAAYHPAKVGMMLAGLEVPHVHVHLAPIYELHDLNFANADPSPDPAVLDEALATIRSALRDAGHGDNVPD